MENIRIQLDLTKKKVKAGSQHSKSHFSFSLNFFLLDLGFCTIIDFSLFLFVSALEIDVLSQIHSLSEIFKRI